MAININLDKVEFYKEDYISDHKLHLTGSITGLDSSKQYCVWWACERSDVGLYVHYNDSMDYFFIDKRSSASFGSSAHIHSDSIIQSPGDYSFLGVYILEVEGNCENYVSSVLVSTNLIFYHDYETPEPTGTVSLDKTSYEQEELVTATWGSANFTGGMFSIINPSGSVKKQLPVNSSAGMLYYELPSDAPLGNWSAVLDYEDIEVDSKTFSVIESQVPPEPCTQHFRVEDQDGNPISCTIYSGYWDFSLDVPSTGEISVSLPPDETYEIIAHSVEHNVEDRKTITTCTTSPVVFILDIPEGKIGTITHEAYEHLGEDEIDFEIPVTNTSNESKRFYVDLRNENGDVLDREPKCNKSIPAGETEIIHMSSVGDLLSPWSFEDVRGQTVTFELILSNSICAHIKIVDTVTHEIEEDIPVPPEIGEIGTITYEIIKQVGNDEITFYIPVTNHTDEEQCFYVNLMNPDDETEVLEKAPNVPLIGRIADRIPAGATETIELSSTWDVRWNINNVLGKTVKFELRHSEPILDALGVVVCNPLKSAYDMIHEVTIDLINIDIIVSICADNTEGLITKDLQIGLMYSDPTTLTKTDVCGSPMNVIDTVSEEICTSYHRPGPFTCSGAAYLADSMFVAYARGFDDEDNEYIITSPIFRSIYGTKNISIKVTGEPIEECFIDHPTDPTKCLITEGQWKVIKWTAAGLGVVYVASVAAPMVKGIGATLEKSQKYKKE